METDMFFPASFDAMAKMVSGLVCAIVVVAAIATQSTIAAGIGALVIALSFGYSPRGYMISERTILVKRLLGNVRIPLEGVREARAATAEDLAGCIRLFGNGGLFGYYGLFRTSQLGKCTWYVTDRSKAVVIVTGTKTAVFSPDDVDGFLATIRASAPVPAAPPGVPQSAGAGRPLGTMLGASIALVALGFAAFSLLYSPGPPNCTLTPQSLTIHDRFYPVTLQARNVDIDGIRVVDVDVDTDWRPTARTNGFANAHYRSGQFRVAGGKVIRMYRAAGRRLVLLPPKGDGTAVLLETRDPEKFAAEVRQAWRAALP
jgi:hypothetical protein